MCSPEHPQQPCCDQHLQAQHPQPQGQQQHHHHQHSSRQRVCPAERQLQPLTSRCPTINHVLDLKRCHTAAQRQCLPWAGQAMTPSTPHTQATHVATLPARWHLNAASASEDVGNKGTSKPSTPLLLQLQLQSCPQAVSPDVGTGAWQQVRCSKSLS